MALSGGSQGVEFTSAFGGAAEVHGRTASAAFDANDPKRSSPWLSNCAATNGLDAHSITASARASSVGGTLMPSALAVLRFSAKIELGRLLDRDVGWLRPAQKSC